VAGRWLFLSIRRRWWLLALTAAAAAVVAWLIASHGAKAYEAHTKLLVGPVSGDYRTLQASSELGRTYAELAASRPIVTAAARAARVAVTPAQAKKAVSPRSNDVTRIIDVRVRHPDPAAATRMAAAVAAQLMRLRRAMPRQELNRVKAILGDPALAHLTHAQRRGVREAVLRAGSMSTAGDLEVVEAPVRPLAPVPRRVGLVVLLATLAALAAAVCATASYELADVDDELEDFEVEDFLRSTNGRGRGGPVERSLDEARSRELS
jgi:uncharacterized protein involved in exopolysaccharide biosynthesis